ncbi:MAG: sulfurtransferase complex subunit TusD [Halioglobus sp.]
MIYSLLVLAAPSNGNNASAFAQAVLARGHSISRVFFMDDGVYHGQGSSITPQDERNPLDKWQSLHEDHGVELVLCISSALKRGILNSNEMQRYEKNAASMHSAFQIGGLGLLIDASAKSDRLITFGR